jgi:hypothetical protein
MKKLFSVFLVLSLLLVLTAVSVTSLTDKEKAVAREYAEMKGWQIPSYEVGWSSLFAQASRGGCLWTRERDGRVFSGGIMGRMSDGSYECFIPGNNKNDFNKLLGKFKPTPILIVPPAEVPVEEEEPVECVPVVCEEAPESEVCEEELVEPECDPLTETCEESEVCEEEPVECVPVVCEETPVDEEAPEEEEEIVEEGGE